MPLVEKRYAEAFLNLAVQNNDLDEYQDELIEISNIYKNDVDFKSFLHNPKNDILTKKRILQKIFEGKVNQNTLNFLLLLLEKDRIKYLPEVCNEFVKLSDERNNILNITILTAAKLDDKSIDRICDKFKKLYNSKSFKANVEIDESLIGGIKVYVGDKLYDGSLKGKLSRLQSVLID